MNHVKALALKYVVVSAILELILLNMTRLRFGEILLISLTVTVIAYVVGDLLILRYTSNIVATIADIGLSLLIVYLFDYVYSYPTITFWTALFCSLVLGMAEWVFHRYVYRQMHWSEPKRTIS